MEIKFLKAGSGDCILLKIENKNILIDGGNDSIFLIEEYNEIVLREEQIDLLIVTHHDDDHIKGILDLFKHIEVKGGNPQILNIVFNSPRKITNRLKIEEETNLLSYKQSYELENFLIKNTSIKWFTSTDEKVKSICENISESLQIKLFSPDEETLLKYASNKGAYLNSDHRCDWQTSFKILNQNLDDVSQDSSLSNETSIVVFVEFNNVKILLTGDIIPKCLNTIIDILKENEDKLKLDFLKLPHHASYRSLNSELLRKINCKNYIISTNSKKHYLPNKRALLKIINNSSSNDQINFLFNYGEVISKLNIDKKELSEYKISLNPNNKNSGYAINI
ncbi:ComEC/Rec2 family competence protein [Flavobacterium sp. 245]|uniref:ComEC/Rec2 family competence protein n=1 Tax=Flavobacterium sp. 245 TaxID=2512115 RepID=UPI00105D4A0E|nr:MBL fold metallo-hydrolase [Flavobacterium sp. 245]TDO96084.1 metallo-beta-lactamase superfamily protein [Flavobacterium sp. 245]